eukprot:sb/3468129/
MAATAVITSPNFILDEAKSHVDEPVDLVEPQEVVLDKSHCYIGDRGGDSLNITPEQAATCTKLSLRRNYIRNADTLLCAISPVSLTWLCLSANALTSVPVCVGKLVNLRHLYLCNNKISVIENLEGCKHLETLEFRHNQIEKLEDGCLASLEKLQTLTLSSNHISTFSPNVFPTSLTFLGLYGNQIADFNLLLSVVERLSNLKTIYMGANICFGGLPLRSSFNIVVEYQPVACGGEAKRQKCDLMQYGFSDVLMVVKEKQPSLISIDGNDV